MLKLTDVTYHLLLYVDVFLILPYACIFKVITKIEKSLVSFRLC